jgi:aspartate aminotransferase
VTLSAENGRWQLDLEQLIDTLQPGTKAVVLNSPNNPTGWVMSAEEQTAVLEHCRKLGIWIIGDDVYSRLYRHGPAAPSFLTLADQQDLVISVNSFSKCWSMTGWRLGWITAPAELEAKLGQLTEFNTSCTPGFIQAAGIVALQQGEADIVDLLQKIYAGYALAETRLSHFERVQFVQPDGAFYCFFKLDGLQDSVSTAKEILHKTKVGLAPGIAFGDEGEGYLRLCYAQPIDVLEQAFDRLTPFLSA